MDSRHQSQRLYAGRIQDLHIAWRDNLGRNHVVFYGSVRCRKCDRIILPNKPQRAKERVPVSGNRDVAQLAWQRGTGNVARGQLEIDPMRLPRSRSWTGPAAGSPTCQSRRHRQVFEVGDGPLSRAPLIAGALSWEAPWRPRVVWRLDTSANPQRSRTNTLAAKRRLRAVTTRRSLELFQSSIAWVSPQPAA